MAAVRDAGTQSPEWIAWAIAKADWFDPTIRAEDPHFGILVHELDEKRKNPEKSMAGKNRPIFYLTRAFVP